MLEIEFVITELEKMKAKEKSLRAKHYLQEAISAIKSYGSLKTD